MKTLELHYDPVLISVIIIIIPFPDDYWLNCEDPENERRPEVAHHFISNLNIFTYLLLFLFVHKLGRGRVYGGGGLTALPLPHLSLK